MENPMLCDKLEIYTPERIYWSCEQVERVAGDVDIRHLDECDYYTRNDADAAFAQLKKILLRYKYKRCLYLIDITKRAWLVLDSKCASYRRKYPSLMDSYREAYPVPSETLKAYTKMQTKVMRLNKRERRLTQIATHYKKELNK